MVGFVLSLVTKNWILKANDERAPSVQNVEDDNKEDIDLELEKAIEKELQVRRLTRHDKPLFP